MSEDPVQPNGTIDYNIFQYSGNQPVIDEARCLDVCGDWSFATELLTDTLRERDVRILELKQAITENNHLEYLKLAHAIKGAALNLHLPALVDVTKKTELLGRQLQISSNDMILLGLREMLMDKLIIEYERLENYLPKAQNRANREAEGEEVEMDGLDGANDGINASF